MKQYDLTMFHSLGASQESGRSTAAFLDALNEKARDGWEFKAVVWLDSDALLLTEKIFPDPCAERLPERDPDVSIAKPQTKQRSVRK